ncbi:D-arabitol-phosphate dehydrogenase [compost metagenome]
MQITAPGTFHIVETNIPKPGDYEVLVEIEIVATCPRWDLNMMAGRDMFDAAVSPQYPLPPGFPGHEAAGFVRETGNKVNKLRIGDRVAALEHLSGNGAYAQYMVYEEKDLIAIPDSVTFKKAVSFELLKCVLMGMTQFEDMRGRTVLISGLGPAGILAVQLAHIWGASQVVGLDLNEDRLAYVRSLGFDVCHPQELGQARFDFGYDCVGFSSSVQHLLAHVDRHVVIFGVQKGDVVFGDSKWGTGIKLETYNGRPVTARDCELLLDAVTNKGLNTECIQTHHVPFTEYEKAVRLLSDQEAVKVHFYPGRDFD